VLRHADQDEGAGRIRGGTARVRPDAREACPQAQKGHFAKASVKPAKLVREFREPGWPKSSRAEIKVESVFTKVTWSP